MVETQASRDAAPPGAEEEAFPLPLTVEERRDVISQIQYLHNEAMGVQSAFLGSIALPVGVFALIIYYALQSDKPATIFIILPFLFSLSIFNLLKYTIKILGIDAYIRQLELLLNESYQKPLFLWQNTLVYANGYSLLGGLAQLPAFLAVFLFLMFQFFRYLPECDWFPYAPEIFTALLIVQGISLLLLLAGCATQYHAVEASCLRIFGQRTVRGAPTPRQLRTEVPYLWRNRRSLGGMVRRLLFGESPNSGGSRE